MNIKALVVSVGLSVLAATACGEKASDSEGGESGGTSATGGSGQGGSSGTAGSGAGTAGSGPAITTAPPAWVRPADCGGIGDRCADLTGCGSLSVCQLEGYVCIPSLRNGMLQSRSPEYPYCAAYTCMSFDEASCFCTGEAGAGTPSCSSPGALAGICMGLEGSCASKACCDGLTCVDVGGAKACKQGCASATDCATGCCTDRYDTGVQVCAALDACTNPCKRQGEACAAGSSSTPSNCCRGSCVESSNPDYAGCRPTCTTNDQCDTGCCVPFANSASGFCASAEYCSCGATGAACGPSSPACCENTVCAGQSAETLTCLQQCGTDADCPGTVCRPLSDNSANICDETCAMLNSACGPGSPNCCSGMTCAGNDTDGFTCFRSCTVPTDCPSGYCDILSDGMTGICIE